MLKLMQAGLAALLAALGGADVPGAGEPGAAPPGAAAQTLYNGLNRPVIIDITSPRTFGNITLALMDADGKPLGEPLSIKPGRIDLAEKMPAIWSLRTTAYLQVMDGGEPVGSALVLQPMLSRMVPVMESAKRPSGAAYMRIARWIDENQPPPQLPPQSQPQSPSQPAAPAATSTPPPYSPAPASTQPSLPRPAVEPTPAKPAAEPPPVERLFTGLRIYPERDVILHTTHGDIRIALRPDEAPNTAWNFLELARGGFFRDIQFHRIVPLTAQGVPFVIQAGDPTATGDGGPGYWLPIEESRLPHDFGVISMARSDDPDSAGSQIFICLSREGTARLDGQYCSFGYAVDGAQAIKSIAGVELADVEAGRPADPPLIRQAEVVAAPPRTPGSGRPDGRVLPNSRPVETRPNRVPR